MCIRRLKSFFAALFLGHPVEKLASLVLASLIIFVIQRQLVTQVFDGRVKVLVEQEDSKSSGDRLRVLYDRSRFVVRRQEDATVPLTVFGAAKMREELPTPLRVEANLPEERFLSVSGSESGWQRISLEDRDLRVIGVHDLKFDLHGGVRLEVARLVERKKPLTHSFGGRLADGMEARVSFQPPQALVRGAAPVLRSLPQVAVLLEARSGRQEVTQLVSAGVRLSKDQRIIAEVDLHSSFRTLVVPNVEVRLGVAQKTQYEFALGEPLAIGGRTPVSLEGPAKLVTNLEGNKEALARLAASLTLVVDAERVARDNDAKIRTQPKGYLINAPAYLLRLPAELAAQGFHQAPVPDTVPLIIKHRSQ